MLYKSRELLQELRRIELTQESDHQLAQLQAEGAASPEEAAVICGKADKEYARQLALYEELRSKLPNEVRKLTAGYELRV